MTTSEHCSPLAHRDLLAVGVGRAWSAVFASAPRDDPFEPTDIDPDDARDAACDATAGGDLCRITEQPDIDPDDLPDLPSSGGGGGGTAGVLGTMLVVVLVVAILVGVVWLAKSWLDAKTDDHDDDGGELDEDLDEAVDARIVDRETPPQRWRRSAEEHRRAGRYRDATRCEYRALVGDLARAGYVDEIPGRTSGEERRQIAELAPHVADDFGTAADLFDAAWFNDDEVTAAHDERFVTAERAVLDTVLTGAMARRR